MKKRIIINKIKMMIKMMINLAQLRVKINYNNLNRR